MKNVLALDRKPKASELIWLAYLGFLFIEPVVAPRPHLWVATLAVIAFFVPFYLLYFRSCSFRVHLTVVLITTLLGAFTLPWNGGGTTFFIFTAAFLPFTFQGALKPLIGFALEILIMCAEAHWITTPGFRIPWLSVVLNSALLVIIGGSNIFFAKQKQSDKKLRMAQEEIEALAAVAERERIARDLHDVLGHTLSLIVLKAELAGRLLSQNTEAATTRAAAEIHDVERTARTALAEVREAIGGYRSRGLAAEIETARKTLSAAGVDLHAEASDIEGTTLSAAEETVLALALREAVTNIVRHAHARTCRLRFVTQEGVRRLTIEDDGENTNVREGNGLRGMRERVESLGGQLLLTRSNGTRLELSLPT